MHREPLLSLPKIVLISMVLMLNYIPSNSHSIGRARSYDMLREQLVLEEEERYFGTELQLRGYELIANQCLMRAKVNEVNEGFQNPDLFLPAQNFLIARENIERSPVFKIIKRMPKGGNLHAHYSALVSKEFLVKNLVNQKNLFVCTNKNQTKYRFFDVPDDKCEWKNFQDLLQKNASWESQLTQSLTMQIGYYRYGVDNANELWDKFENIFSRLKGVLRYRPFFEKYLYEILEELYEDNVMYVEVRTTLTKFYELDGHVHSPQITATMFMEIIEKFVKDHPGFMGMKIILTEKRTGDEQSLNASIDIFNKMRKLFPDLIVGFDIIGQEEKGHDLIKNNMAKLQELGKNASFFFHAGETKWFGGSFDESLYEALLLNTRRIGHGNALTKHPKLLEYVKSKDIPIEINPISNQILNLVQDMRNHPASVLFANGFSVVVANDDPGFWNARGLSYDFYETFMGIMSKKADLRALKKLAINSIRYSAMNSDEKDEAYRVWEDSWMKFVKDISNDALCK